MASLWGWGQLSATAAHQGMAYQAMHACQYAAWRTRECVKAAVATASIHKSHYGLLP